MIIQMFHGNSISSIVKGRRLKRFLHPSMEKNRVYLICIDVVASMSL